MKTIDHIRQIDVFDKKTERLITEIKLDTFDLVLMKSRFNVSNNDPLMFKPYEINRVTTDLFPEINFDFIEYDYYLACYQKSSI